MPDNFSFERANEMTSPHGMKAAKKKYPESSSTTTNLTFEIGDNRIVSRYGPYDIQIVVGKDHFSAHRELLKAHSTFFKRKLEGESKYAQEIELEKVDKDGLQWCIEYMYSDSCLPEENKTDIKWIERVLQTAKFLEMQALQHKCQESLRSTQKKTCQESLPSTQKKTESMLSTYSVKEYQRKQNDGSGQIPKQGISDLPDTRSSADDQSTESKAKTQIKFVKKRLEDQLKDEQFSEISEEEFMISLTESNAEPTVVWRAITLWTGQDTSRKRQFHKALGVLLGTKKDLAPILLTVLQHHHVQKDQYWRPRILLDIKALEFVDFQKIIKLTDQLTNEEKWTVIVSWVSHDASRETHALELIKTMDLTKLRKTFISRTIKNEPFVKNSKACTDFLLSVLPGGNQTRSMYPKLAILDDNQHMLTLLDSNIRNCAKISIPQRRHISKIATFCGEIYIQHKGQIQKLTNDGAWSPIYNYTDKPESWTRFVSFADRLAIISKESITLYKQEDKSVEGFEGCGLGNGFSCTGSDSCLFAVGGSFTHGTARKFTMDKRWADLPVMPVLVSEPALAYFKDKLFVMGGSYLGINSNTVVYFQNNSWTTAASMIHRRSRFGAVIHQDQLFVTGGSSGLFKRHEIVEEYRVQSDSWQEAGKTELTKGIMSIAVYDGDTSGITFKPCEYGIKTTMPLQRSRTVR